MHRCHIKQTKDKVQSWHAIGLQYTDRRVRVDVAKLNVINNQQIKNENLKSPFLLFLNVTHQQNKV